MPTPSFPAAVLLIPLFVGLLLAPRTIAADELTAGEALQGTLDPSSPSSYGVLLEAGRVAWIEVSQVGLDVELQVADPSGTVLAQVDQSPVRESLETFAWTVSRPGRHVVTLATKRASPQGRFVLRLVPSRGPEAEDPLLLEGQRAFEAGVRARRSEQADLRPGAAEAFIQAATSWRQAGAQRAATRALIAAGAVRLGTSPSLAVEPCETALGLAQEGGDVAQEAAALTCLAEAFYPLGAFDEMIESQRSGLDAAVASGNRFLEAEALQNLGVFHFARREIDLVRARHEDALQLARAIGDDTVEGIALASLAAVMNEAGEYQPANDLLQEALSIHRRTGDLAAQGNALINLAAGLRALGDHEAATAAAQQVVAISRQANYPLNETYGHFSLSAIAGEVGDFDAAKIHAREALEIARRTHAQREEVRSLDWLALAHFKAGELDEALRAASASVALSRSLGHPPSPQALLNLCRLHEATDDVPRAAASCEEALASLRTAGTQRLEPMATYLLARLERRRGNPVEARARVEESLAFLERTQDRVRRPDWRGSFIGSHREIDDFYVDLMIEAAMAAGGAANAAEAFDAAERVRARALRDALTESRVAGQEQVDGRLVERRRQLRRQLARAVEAQVRRPGSTAEPATAALKTELHQVEGEIRRLRPRYAELAGVRSTTAREVQESLLDTGTVLLAYAVGDARSALWIVTRDTLEMHTLPPRARLEPLARETYASMSRSGEGNADAPRQLAQLILGPAIPRLRDRVLVIGDGALHYVPFGALPDPRGGVLLDRHEVVALPSASTVRLLKQAPAAAATSSARRTVAVFADPVFRADDERIAAARRGLPIPASGPGADVGRATRDVDVDRLSRLPFTRREARQIASLLKGPNGATLALDFEASLETVGEWKLADYRFVHFATHGFLNTKRPELSGLVLSLYDREGRPRQGFLSSLDAFNLDLSADVVTLSGCRTALGKEVWGEGLVGLSQAFLYAGARRVVSTLWGVDDLATSALMSRFYQGLLAPQPLRPAAALRAAQSYVRSQPQWTHPYFWAGFQLQGDWN